MFTCDCLKGLCSCLPCFQNDEDNESTSSSDDLRPLLDRTPPMPPLRKYGTKKSTTSSGSSAIFGRSPPAAREALAELSSQISNLVLSDEESGYKNDDEDSVKEEPDRTLLPLIDAFDFSQKSWDEVLSSSTTTIEKIAEASYAEVYRCTNAEGTSILKVMQLKVSSDPTSLDVSTAHTVQDVIAELRIMNDLTTLPGFVTFKDAYLIKGKPVSQLKNAWDAWVQKSKDESEFPDPDTFGPKSTFLVIELGDAGQELEAVPMKTIEQVWDVLLGVIIALARAESTNEFEHRDLHENNICVLQNPSISPRKINPTQQNTLKFGFSGLEITIIDYGLSRAKLEDGSIAYADLELDLSLFHSKTSGVNSMQFDNYRRMRTYLFTGKRSMHPISWHTEASRTLNNGYTWREYKPYTNVLWIRYLMHYLEYSFKKNGDKREVAEWSAQTGKLRTRLDTRTKVENGAFCSAGEVLEWVAREGWVSAEQIEERGVDSSFLSEA